MPCATGDTRSRERVYYRISANHGIPRTIGTPRVLIFYQFFINARNIFHMHIFHNDASERDLHKYRINLTYCRDTRPPRDTPRDRYREAGTRSSSHIPQKSIAMPDKQ